MSDGTNPGSIYVDNIQHPKSAFLISPESQFLAGDYHNKSFNNSLRKLLISQIFKDEYFLYLHVFPTAWENLLESIIKKRLPIKVDRRHYICKKVKINRKNQIPKGYSIQRLTKKLLTKKDLIIPKHVKTWIKGNWSSINNFDKIGFGYCTMHKNKIVSYCIGDCRSGNECEMGIHTLPEYRKQGLAVLTVAATVDYCLSNGFKKAGWHCNEDNYGSRKTAEKVGFRLERKYTQYHFIFNKVHHLILVGYVLFKKKEYKKAITSFEKAIKKKNPPAWMPNYIHEYYHMIARSWGALGDKDTASNYLKKAINKGWTNIEDTRKCREFKNLHKTEQWKNIIK